MIKLEDRIKAFATVGQILKNLSKEEREYMYQRAKNENSWFTDKNIGLALEGVQRYLDENKLKVWTKDLPSQPQKAKKVGMVMAGNIPLVGFHDFLTVLISGHKLLAKLSSQDSFLLKHIADILTDIEPWFKEQIQFQDRLNEADAMIATGSDNSSRYFEYYFAKMPHIIRHNRTSVAVLDGQETEEELQALGDDIFQYFGLGCRNVAKLYVPEHYDFKLLLDAWQPYHLLIHHHKYNNNYDYNKSILLVNKEPHLDTGFALLRESDQLVSPISMVYYEKYQNVADLKAQLEQRKNKIQCIVSRDSWVENSLPLGYAQQPELWDYADGVDTLAFVSQLS
ncbi:acyl-CoA reductase [Catalinimonas niigatensis]|uniref:acyl-CoA reductase n=1 Tax=Catalinimonas niigatensis TaxID=1397264 RepID=UPI002AA2AA41|nr:acyl-CoA reductase [Catalinimonas niigatensis]WPP49453.1 acyl-CoA reductase [Catalinimonas niigatensis]